MSSRWVGDVKPGPPELEKSITLADLEIESAE
jgi:hypothetical protein